MLMTEPILIFMSLYLSLVYMLLYLFFFVSSVASVAFNRCSHTKPRPFQSCSKAYTTLMPAKRA